MKHIFIKILSVILAVIFTLGLFSGCEQYRDEEYKITNGEFYELFADLNHLSSPTYDKTIDLNYESVEYLLWDRYLLDDEQLGQIDKKVTKELVAQICVRYMNFRQEHSLDIKDIDKCHDRQAVIDGVGMSIFQLENGYFDAKQQLTYDECIAYIEKMREIEGSSHYEETPLDIEYNDNVFVADDIEFTDFEITEQSASSVTDMNYNATGTASVAPLAYNTKQSEPTIRTLDSSNDVCYFCTFKVAKDEYRKYPDYFKVGNIIVKPQGDHIGYGTTNLTNIALKSPEAVKILSIDDTSDYLFAIIKGMQAMPDEILSDSAEEKNINAKTNLKSSSVDTVAENELPEGIKVKTEDGMVVVTFGHTFTITDPIYGKQTWRNPTASPFVNITAKIGNFSIDSKNLGKLLLRKQTNANVKITYKTYFDFTAGTGGLRYSPANNGNGGLKFSPEDGFSGNFFANVSNSRFTGASAGGSEKIKLAQVNFPIGYGFSIDGTLYLTIELDGSISFTLDSTNWYSLELSKTRSGMAFDTDSGSTQQKDLKINANLTVGLELAPSISFFRTSIVDGSISIKAETNAMANLYASTEKVKSSKFYATQEDLDALESSTEFGYCIGIDCKIYTQFQLLTKKSWIGKFVIETLEFAPPSKKVDLYTKSIHFEDGGYVDHCTIGEGDDDAEINDQGEILLDSYKVILNKEVKQTAISLVSFPIGTKKINAYGGIAVSTNNPDIATGQYNESTHTVLITGLREGSTEIMIRIPKGKKAEGYYEQSISVTITEDIVLQSGTIQKLQKAPIEFLAA